MQRKDNIIALISALQKEFKKCKEAFKEFKVEETKDVISSPTVVNVSTEIKYIEDSMVILVVYM